MLKKNKSKHVQENNLHAPSGPSLNSIVSGTQLEGDVVSQSDIRIDGIIKGNLNCSSKVIIGPSGVVEGTIECNCALIEGSFEGVINVEELLQKSENFETRKTICILKFLICTILATRNVPKFYLIGNPLVYLNVLPQTVL